MTDAGRKPTTWLDHFVIGIHDLEVGIRAFEELTGVRAAYGGEHPALGTHNALVSLGPREYLEILAPRPGARVSSGFAQAVGRETLTPILMALASEDVRAVHQAVTEAGYQADDVSTGSRVTPQGDHIRWSMFMMRGHRPTGAPFFLEWSPETVHPSETNPPGCSVASFRLTTPDHGPVARLLDVVGFDVPVDAGDPCLSVTLHTPRGDVTLGG